MLLRYSRVAIVQPEQRKFTSRTTFMLKSCNFPACRGPGGNRTRDRGIAKAGAQTTRQLQKTISRALKTHGATATIFAEGLRSASTRTIRAEGSSAHRKNAKNLEFLHLDHADPRRGSRGHRQKRKKQNKKHVPRPRRSPQRVHPRRSAAGLLVRSM